MFTDKEKKLLKIALERYANEELKRLSEHIAWKVTAAERDTYRNVYSSNKAFIESVLEKLQ